MRGGGVEGVLAFLQCSCKHHCLLRLEFCGVLAGLGLPAGGVGSWLHSTPKAKYVRLLTDAGPVEAVGYF